MSSIIVLLIQFIYMNIMRTMGNNDRPPFLIAICIFSFVIAFYNDLSHSVYLWSLKTPIMAGLFWRIFLLYFDTYGHSVFVLPNSGADSAMFYNYAVSIAEGGSRTRTFFPVVMGHIFRWIGPSMMYGQFLLVICSMISICVLARILFYFDIQEQVRELTIWLIGLLPNYAILSALFVREAIVCMFLTISLYFYIRWFKDGRIRWMLIAFAGVGIASVFHSGAAGMALGYILILLLYDSRKGNIQLRFANIVFAIIISIVIAYLYVNFGDVLFSKMQGVDSIEDIANTNESGGSSYAAYVGNSNSIVNMVIYTPIRMIYFLFSPFPWQWRGIRDIIAFMFSSLFYIISVVNAVQYVLRENDEKKNAILTTLIIAVAITFVFAWGTSNTGTASRHREKMVCIYGLLFALSYRGRLPVRNIG